MRFENCDASKKLPFGDPTFDAAFSNDVLCHLPGRPAVLGELFRVIRRGGRILFRDALIIGGTISHQEIAARSSIGYYLFSPPGEDERMLKEKGFLLVSVLAPSLTCGSFAEANNICLEPHPDHRLPRTTTWSFPRGPAGPAAQAVGPIDLPPVRDFLLICLTASDLREVKSSLRLGITSE